MQIQRDGGSIGLSKSFKFYFQTNIYEQFNKLPLFSILQVKVPSF